MKQHLVPDLVLSADASKKGVGGYYTNAAFYHLDVPREWQHVNIAYLELWAVIISLRIWADKLIGLKIVMQCDNESVVNILTFGGSRDLFLQVGMREIVFLQALHRFELKVVHISSEQNRICDWLSRWRDKGSRLAFQHLQEVDH